MRGLSDITKATLLVTVAIIVLAIAIVTPSWSHNPKTALLHVPVPIYPVYPANVSYTIVKSYQLNKTYLINLTINLEIVDTKLPSVFVTEVAIANSSDAKSLTYVPVKITYIADEYNNSKTEVVSSTNPEEVPIKIGYNFLTIKGFVIDNLNFSSRTTLILISFSNNEKLSVLALLNVTDAL